MDTAFTSLVNENLVMIREFLFRLYCLMISFGVNPCERAYFHSHYDV